MLLTVLYSACTLAGDITPPAALATAQAAAPLPTSIPVAAVSAPRTSPNLAVGAQLYADHCAACHGPTGMGDGEMASGLSFPAAVLADPELARAASPQDWYQVVTNGRLDRQMPPFVTLSDQARWDAVGYALSLSIPAEELQSGELLFAEQCAECHAEQLFGNDYFRVAAREEIQAVVQAGRGSAMPAYTEQLSADQLWALADYVQSLGWSESPGTEAALEPAAVRVVGQIDNGTAGATVPADLEVTVLGFDGEQQVVEQVVSADSQGQFRLDRVEAAPGRLFFATIDYQDVVYRSEVAHAPADGGPLELPLTIYETTSDLSALRVERLHLLIDFPQPGLMRVLQLWVVGNTSDRVLAPALQVALPTGATNLAFEEDPQGDRFELVENGFIDHEPVPPGSAIDQLAFGFDLAIEGSTEFSQLMQHPVDAVTILVPADGPPLAGLIDDGLRDLGGLSMHTYSAGVLEVGDSLSFRVSGSRLNTGQVPAILVGAAALLAAGFVAFRAWVRPAAEQQNAERSESARRGPTGTGRRDDGWLGPGAGKPQAAAPEEQDAAAETQALLRAIAQLDAEHEAGSLSDDEWQRRRVKLKRLALDRMRMEGD